MTDYKNAVQEVIDGNINPLEVYAKLKKEIKELTECLSLISDYAVEEALKMDSKTFELKGYKFEVRNGSARYSFKNIPEWSEKQKELKEIESIAKIAYSSYQKGVTTLSQDAEIVALPEVTYSKDVVVVKEL